MKVKRPGGWAPDVFRPFADRADLTATLVYAGSPEAPKLLVDQREDWVFRQRRLKQLHTDAVKDFLPPLEESTVRSLLDRPFSSVRGREWVPGGFAADVKSGFHIVPPGYAATFVPVTANTCSSCHRTAGANARRSGFPAPAGWDEWIRGNAADESFSFHIFAPESVSGDGQFKPMVLHPSLTRAGLLKRREGG
jgi:hypothetical protein